MKIIDEKGKLFGKINVVDFLVVLFLLCMLPAFYFGYKILNRPSEVKKLEDVFIAIAVDAVFKNLEPEVAELISVGDKEKNAEGNVIGEILEMGKVESNFVEVDLGEGRTITKEDYQRKQVSVKIRLIGRLDHNDVFYKGNKVNIGSLISFKTDRYEIKGIIIPEPYGEIEVSKAGFSLIKIDLLFKNLSPEIAKLISVGDFEADKSGDTIAKTLSKGKPEPYSYKVDLGGGNYITRTDPKKRQVLAKMEIMGRIEGNTFYFKEKRIALDSTIEFNTNKYRIEGLVIRQPTQVKKIDRKWVALKVKFTNLIPELVSCINESDEERDVSGVLLAKVISILSNEPTETMVLLKESKKVSIVTYPEKVSIVKYPMNRDVILLIESFCIKTQNGLFFKESRIKIGNSLFLQTKEYDIKGMIIGIEEKKD